MVVGWSRNYLKVKFYFLKIKPKRQKLILRQAQDKLKNKIMERKNIVEFLLNFTSIDELVIFGISIFIGYKFQVLYGVVFAILCLWVKLKYYEGKILEDYCIVDEIEKDITSNPNLPKNLAKRRIEDKTKPYYSQIQRQYETKRKFLIDKLAIITFIGLLLINKL